MNQLFDTSFEGHDSVRRAKHGMPWTSYDLANLHNMFQKGLSLKALCEHLQRPAAGVVPKLVNLKLIERAAHGDYIHCKSPVTPGFVELPLPTTYTKEPIMTKPVANIESKTFIAGVDASTMDDAAIFRRIAEIERDIAKLEDIKAKPNKLVAAIETLQSDIKKLVEYVDGRP